MGKPLRKVTATSEDGEKDTMEALLDEIRSSRQLQQVPKEEKGSYKLRARRHRRGAVRDQANESDKKQDGRKGNKDHSDGKLHHHHHHHKREEDSRKEHHHGNHGNHKHAQKEHLEGKGHGDEEGVQDDHSREMEDEDKMVDGKKEQHANELNSTVIMDGDMKELRGSPDEDEGYTEEEMAADSKQTIPRAERQEGTQSMPAWKVALLNKKKGQAEQKTAPPLEDATEPPAQQNIDGDEAIPSWKVALIKKKQTKPSSESAIQDPFAGIPEWKQKLLKQKMEAKAAEEKAMLEKRRMEEEKRAEVAAMPGWKRELYIKKNPQYA